MRLGWGKARARLDPDHGPLRSGKREIIELSTAVRHDVVQMIVLLHDKTCRPIGSTLGGCGEVVMPPCKAPLIMYPLAKASAQTARRVRSRKCLREKARVDSMVNICECPKNVVNNDKLKTRAKGLGQKARRRVQGSVVFLSWANNTVGVQDRPNLSSSSERNVVSPKSPSE